MTRSSEVCFLLNKEHSIGGPLSTLSPSSWENVHKSPKLSRPEVYFPCLYLRSKGGKAFLGSFKFYGFVKNHHCLESSVFSGGREEENRDPVQCWVSPVPGSERWKPHLLKVSCLSLVLTRFLEMAAASLFFTLPLRDHGRKKVKSIVSFWPNQPILEVKKIKVKEVEVTYVVTCKARI